MSLFYHLPVVWRPIQGTEAPVEIYDRHSNDMKPFRESCDRALPKTRSEKHTINLNWYGRASPKCYGGRGEVNFCGASATASFVARHRCGKSRARQRSLYRHYY